MTRKIIRSVNRKQSLNIILKTAKSLHEFLKSFCCLLNICSICSELFVSWTSHLVSVGNLSRKDFSKAAVRKRVETGIFYCQGDFLVS